MATPPSGGTVPWWIFRSSKISYNFLALATRRMGGIEMSTRIKLMAKALEINNIYILNIFGLMNNVS